MQVGMRVSRSQQLFNRIAQCGQIDVVSKGLQIDAISILVQGLNSLRLRSVKLVCQRALGQPDNAGLSAAWAV